MTMDGPARADQYRQIIREGCKLLEAEKAYQQANILRKLVSLDKKISPSSLSKILNGIDVGNTVLRKGGEGVLEIVRQELGYTFDKKKMAFNTGKAPEGWKPYIIPEREEGAEEEKGRIIIHPNGRLPIGDKVAFMASAQEEVIEMGVRLRTFADYFTSRNEHEFKLPVYSLLERGCHYKAYLLDPESNEASHYFHDRAQVQEEEGQSIEKIRAVLRKLSRIVKEVEAEGFPGKFQVFLYKHIPYNHFLIVDGERLHGKMLVSPYLYGINRANCPVIELAKQADRSLFRRYYHSFQCLIRGARPWKG